MAKGANGTIQINTQTIKQRDQFGGTDGKFGVASDRLGTGALFPLSPIALNSSTEAMYQGTASGAGSGLQNGTSNIYEVYANVIDPVNNSSQQGFGFNGQTTENDTNYGEAYLNYLHPNNPFKQADDTIDYGLLTKGTKHTLVKAYSGFPDLGVGDIDNPGLNQLSNNITTDLVADSTSSKNLALTGDGASYGNTAGEYRTQAASASNNMLGTHLESGQGNGDTETLGKYFRNNYTD